MKDGIFHINLNFAGPILLLFLLSLSIPGLAQDNVHDADYIAVDSFVVSVRYENDYIKLGKDLAAPFRRDVDKTRAIFKWIANNIAFDYKAVNSGKEIVPPECEEEYNCVDILRSWENNYLKRILKTRRAVAEGYCRLFQKLCEINHIQSELIPGYARTKPYQIGNKISASHTWNAVFLDTSWYFLDVTWASGYCPENDDGLLIRFVREFQPYYWLNDFKKFSRNHYPKNLYWGQQHQLSLENFFNKPHYYSAEILENISSESPMNGMLNVRKGDSIVFEFDYKKDIRFIQVNSNNFRNPSLWMTVPISKKKTKIVRDTWAEKKQVYIPFEKVGNHYRFSYVVNDNSLYYIELVFDYKKAIRYKINVVK